MAKTGTTIKLTDAEYQLLDQIGKELNLNRTQVIQKYINSKQIIVLPNTKSIITLLIDINESLKSDSSYDAQLILQKGDEICQFLESLIAEIKKQEI